MKVSELREILDKYPDSMEIYLSADEEGNSFSKLDDVYRYNYDGDFMLEDDELVDYEPSDFEEVLVIWP